MQLRQVAIFSFLLGLAFTLTGGAQLAHHRAAHTCCEHNALHCHDETDDTSRGPSKDAPPTQPESHKDCATCVMLAGLVGVEAPDAANIVQCAVRALAVACPVDPTLSSYALAWSARGPPMPVNQLRA